MTDLQYINDLLAQHEERVRRLVKNEMHPVCRALYQLLAEDRKRTEMLLAACERIFQQAELLAKKTEKQHG